MRTRILLAALVVVVAGSATEAQLGYGNAYLGTTFNAVVRIDRVTKALTTIATAGSGTTFQWVAADRFNLSALIAQDTSGTDRILRLSSTGSMSTAWTVSGSASGHIPAVRLDQDNYFLAFSQAGNSIFKSVGGTSTTTVKTGLPSLVNGGCIDDDTGDYVTAHFSGSGAILRTDRRTKATSTIRAGLASLSSVEHRQTDGRFVVTKFTTPTLMILNRNGSTFASVASAPNNGCYVDDTTGHVHACGGGRVVEYDENLTAINTYGTYAVSFSGIYKWGDQISGPNGTPTGQKGTTYNVANRFTRSLNKSYCAAIGISGLRPGISVAGGRWINCRPDAVFFATVCGSLPYWTSGFAGTTSSSNGTAISSFEIPATAGTDSVITFVAGAVNAALPGGIDVAAAQTVTVSP